MPIYSAIFEYNIIDMCYTVTLPIIWDTSISQMDSIHVDKSKISQVIGNVLSFAIKHSSSDSKIELSMTFRPRKKIQNIKLDNVKSKPSFRRLITNPLVISSKNSVRIAAAANKRSSDIYNFQDDVESDNSFFGDVSESRD